MHISVGIDAGGTYTDAVLYDAEQREILGQAKALTTKEDLAVGISQALDGLDAELLRQAAGVSLSTTLATNACVEGKGGNGKLVFIGVNPKTVGWVGDSYGLPPAEDMRFLKKTDGRSLDAFVAKHSAWLTTADGIAVVDKNAVYNSAVLEKKLARRIEEDLGVPVICGYELNNELNSLRRGTSTLLNVRLIPVIAEFLQAIRATLAARGITAPVSIVRSDGSLMSESFTRVRPVETLLCGPAAGLISVARTTQEPDCVVADMGGTTTDISLIRGHAPLRAEGGIRIGPWNTFVKGVFVDTLGLGGDSTLHVGREGRLTLEAQRAIPLCIAASRWPRVKEDLQSLAARRARHTRPLHEFFVLARPFAGRDMTAQEQRFCEGLSAGPVSYEAAAALWGSDLYNLRPERLEREGIVMRCGLTPTDIMHVKGDFDEFDAEAARLGADFVAASTPFRGGAFADAVYDLVKGKLYANIVRVLLGQQNRTLRKNGPTPEVEQLVAQSWRAAQQGETSLVKPMFHTTSTLVGIGAPIHLFLPDVAKALDAPFSIPENARVANALGAAVGHIETVYRLEVKATYTDAGEGFVVQGPYEVFESEEKEEALENARTQAGKAAREEARRRGLEGELHVETTTTHRECVTGYGSELYLGSVVEAVASGAAG